MTDSPIRALAPDGTAAPHPSAVDAITGGLLGALYEQLPHGVVVHAADGRIVAANAAAGRALGLTPDELYGRVPLDPAWGAIDEHGAPLPGHDHPAAVALRTGEPVVDRLMGVRNPRERDLRWLRVTAIPRVPPERAAPERVYAVFTDVTDEVEGARAARFIADAATRLQASLDIAETLAGVTALAVPLLADWCALDVLEEGEIRRVAVHHPDPARLELARELRERYPSHPRDPRGVAEVLRTGRELVADDVTDGMLAALTRDDEHLRLARGLGIRALAILPLVMQGRVLGTLSLVMAESGRAWTPRRLATARDLAARAAVAIDHARLYGAAQAEIARRRAAEEELRAANRELDARRVQLEEQAIELEMTNQQLQEQQVELEAQAEELQATTEQLAQHVTELEEARDAAEAANRAKSDFLAAMSHELRTPLNAITGYVDLLSMGVRGAMTDAQQEDLSRIRRSGDHLLRLINDILQFAKLEAGQLEFRVGAVPLDEALRDLEALIAPQVRARQLAFTMSVDPAQPCARADRDKLQQVVLNLLSNAIKATAPGGSVRLHVGADHARGLALVSVEDTGIGIPAAKLPTIFDPFVQVDRQLNRPGEGIGLGLAISRDLARTMGGEITVRSEVGRGSTFTLELPLAQEGAGRGSRE